MDLSDISANGLCFDHPSFTTCPYSLARARDGVFVAPAELHSSMVKCQEIVPAVPFPFNNVHRYAFAIATWIVECMYYDRVASSIIRTLRHLPQVIITIRRSPLADR